MLRLTPVVRNIIIINVIVYIAQNLIPGVTSLLSLWNPQTENFRPYQLFTYMFAHSPESFFHIFFNMLVLASTAPVLENFWGQKKFLIFYLVTGIGAGVFHLVMHLFFFPERLWFDVGGVWRSLWHPDGIWYDVSKYGDEIIDTTSFYKGKISGLGLRGDNLFIEWIRCCTFCSLRWYHFRFYLVTYLAP